MLSLLRKLYGVMASQKKADPPPPIRVPRLSSDMFAPGLTNTIELAPPACLDDAEFQEKVRFYGFLMEQGIVQGVTIPDWPRYPPWFVSVTTLMTRLSNLLGMGWPLPFHHFVEPTILLEYLHRQWTHIPHRRILFTIGAQHFSARMIADKIVAAGRVGATDFLVVSGAAPKRRLYRSLTSNRVFIGCRDWLLPMDALKVIELVQQLQARGSISSQATILAVHNPYVDDVQRVTHKIQAGARLILTQPPILRDDALRRHWQALQAESGMDKISVGMPYIPSSKALRFWYFLIGIPVYGGWLPEPFIASRRKAAWLQYQEFRQHERRDRQTPGQFMHQWNDRLRQDIQRLPGVAGMHTMPAMAWRRLVGADYYRQEAHRLARTFRAQGVRLEIAANSTARPNVRDLYRVLLALERLVQQGQLSMADLRQMARVYLMHTIRSNRLQLPLDTRDVVVVQDGAVADTGERDIMVDLRQFHAPQASIEHKLGEDLRRSRSGPGTPSASILIEDFQPMSRSRFLYGGNRFFWNEYLEFQQALNVDFKETIGGSPDSDPRFAAYLAETFLDALTKVHQEPVYFVELGATGAEFINHFLDALDRLTSGSRKRQLLEMLTYVVAGYSAEVIRHVRDVENMHDHFKSINVQYLTLHNADPVGQLQAVLGGPKALFIHATNVFDNLPTDRMVRRDGRYYVAEAQTLLPMESAEVLGKKYHLHAVPLQETLRELRDKGDLPAFIQQYKDFFTTYQRDAFRFYAFWIDFWQSLKLHERFVRIEDIHSYPVIPSVRNSGQILHHTMSTVEGNIEFPVNVRAIELALGLIEVLHPHGGTLGIVDLILATPQELLEQARRSVVHVYDGTLVFYLNGALFMHMTDVTSAIDRHTLRELKWETYSELTLTRHAHPGSA